MIKAEHGKRHQLGLDVRTLKESGKDLSIETGSFASKTPAQGRYSRRAQTQRR